MCLTFCKLAATQSHYAWLTVLCLLSKAASLVCGSRTRDQSWGEGTCCCSLVTCSRAPGGWDTFGGNVAAGKPEKMSQGCGGILQGLIWIHSRCCLPYRLKCRCQQGWIYCPISFASVCTGIAKAASSGAYIRLAVCLPLCIELRCSPLSPVLQP